MKKGDCSHPQLSTPRASYSLLVYRSFQNFFIFRILGLKFGTYLQEAIARGVFGFGSIAQLSRPGSTKIDSNMLMRFWQLPGKLGSISPRNLHVPSPPLPTPSQPLPQDFEKKFLKKGRFSWEKTLKRGEVVR
jgi:hypothetical protein